MNCTAEPLSTIVKDVIMSLAAIATAFAALWTARTAYRGLNTWKIELNEKVNIELCRKILSSLYRIQTTVEITRKKAPTDISGAFAPLADEMDKLLAKADMAEVLWNDQIKMEVKKLKDLITELYVEHISPREDRLESDKIKFGGVPDPFGLDFQNVLTSIRKIVKLHLWAK